MQLHNSDYSEYCSVYDDPTIRWRMLQFGRNNDPDQLLEDILTAETLQRYDSPEALGTSGALFLDIASRMGNDAERLMQLENSEDALRATVDMWMGTEQMDYDVLRAAMNLACLPIRKFLLFDRCLPDTETQAEIHADLLDLARTGTELYSALRHGTPKKWRTSGVLGELTLLMLDSRFTNKVLGDNSRQATPALYSEDHVWSTKNEAQRATPWDISVYTQFAPNQAALTYKIDAKASEDASRKLEEKEETPDDEDVDVVTIQTDLAVTADEYKKIPGQHNIKGVSSQQILSELLRESDGTASQADIDNLDMRTAQFLDILD